MQKRRPGEDVTAETRAEAEALVPRQVRYGQIMAIMTASGQPMTAKEVAVEMHRRGYVPEPDRNAAAPRLTEMSQIGLVEPTGRKRCEYTGRSVAVYEVRHA